LQHAVPSPLVLEGEEESVGVKPDVSKDFHGAVGVVGVPP
jgi:hypothetical protein